MNKKECINCKYSIANKHGLEFLGCSHPKNHFIYCSTNREKVPFLIDILFGLCGNRGRWFEAKENLVKQ